MLKSFKDILMAQAPDLLARTKLPRNDRKYLTQRQAFDLHRKQRRKKLPRSKDGVRGAKVAKVSAPKARVPSGNRGAPETTLKSGGARIIVEWAYDNHEVVLTRRNWARVKRGDSLRVRSRGYYEGASQWEYWNFAGCLDGDLVVEYGSDGGQGFVGQLHDATIEEIK